MRVALPLPQTILLALLFALSGPSPRAWAGATPEAARVIERYVAATGGSAAFASEKTLYTSGRLEGFGFVGRIESWSARPDRHYSRTELGPFKFSEGSDGRVSWRTDPTTGRVVRLTDRDSIDSVISTWFSLERWAEPDQGGGRVEVAAHERDSLGAYTVLAVSAPGQADPKPRRLWFADATGLLVKEEAARDQAWVITTAEDYRRAAGRLRPFVNATGISSMPVNRLRTVADTFAVNLDVSGVSFGLPDSGGGNALRWLGRPGIATLPFEYHARHVWLRGSINGGPECDLLFDTGASVTVIDSTFAAASGLPVQGYMQAAGAGAAGSASFTTLGSLSVRSAAGDGVELRDLKVAVMSVAPMFSRYFWRDFAGIVGYDVISRFVVTIDYDSTRLVLRDPKTFRWAGTEAALPMKLNGVVPSLEAVIDGRYRGQFRLDVGSSSTVDLHTPFVRNNDLGKRLRDARDVSGAGFGGGFNSSLGRLHTMAIGPYSWRDPMVILSRVQEGALASEDFAGNIGNRILERFRVTLDYDGRRVWLEPGRLYRERDAFTRSGLMLGWTKGRMDALSVLPGSPAESAGIREGDEVTAVDGRATGEWQPAALEAALEAGPDGREVRVTVKRDGREEVRVMKVKEMLK
jgi:hypothetical protein